MHIFLFQPSSRSGSPSIETLNRQKQKLLAEICESSVFLDTSDINSTANADDDKEDCEKNETPSVPAALISKVLKTDYGTPILESCSPFSKLPNSEQWSKGVSDVINFENLPDSTGKYERMKSLIVKVREHVTKYNSEV
jgi:zinc finger CCHC domain-containing protein 8